METYYANICILGSAQTGKRTLNNLLQTKNLLDDPEQNISVKLKIDVSNDYTMLEDNNYFCIILLYDIVSQASVEYFEETIQFIEAQNIKYRSLALVGTKRDLVSSSNKRTIKYDYLQQLQLNKNALWSEISLTRGDNVQQFKELFCSKIIGCIQLLSPIEVSITPLSIEKVDFANSPAGVCKCKASKQNESPPPQSRKSGLEEQSIRAPIEKAQTYAGLADLANLDRDSDASGMEAERPSLQWPEGGGPVWQRWEREEEGAEAGSCAALGRPQRSFSVESPRRSANCRGPAQQQGAMCPAHNDVQPLIKLEQKIQAKQSASKPHKSAQENRREIHDMIQKRVARNVAMGLKRTPYEKHIVYNQAGAREIKSTMVNKDGIVVFPKQVIQTKHMKFDINLKEKDQLHSEHWTGELRRKQNLHLSKLDEIKYHEMQHRNSTLQHHFEERNKRFLRKRQHIATLQLEVDRKTLEIPIYNDSDLKELAKNFVAKYHLQKAFITQIYAQLLTLHRNAIGADIRVTGCYNNENKPEKLLMALEFEHEGRLIRTNVFRGDSADTVVQRLLAESSAGDVSDLRYEDLIAVVAAALPQ